MKREITTLIATALFTLVLTACGGGGGSTAATGSGTNQGTTGNTTGTNTGGQGTTGGTTTGSGTNTGTGGNSTGSSGGTNTGTTNPPAPQAKAIEPCKESNNDKGLSQAKVIDSGKTIHKLTDPTTIRVWHFKSGERKACIVNGDAEVL